MANSQFSTATLVADGTVAVDGTLEIDPEGLLTPEVEFRFLLVQGDVVVQGRGRGTNGFWSGKTLLGQPTLQEGDALAIGLAFATRRDPPGYESFTWADRIRLAP
jgi:hypothetical protein